VNGTRAYEAVVFDLDGVICFTDVYHYRGWKSVADELGIPFDETVNNRLRGVSRMESLEIILEPYEGQPLSDDRKVELATIKNDRYRVMLGELSPQDLDPAVRTTLDDLRGRGLKLAIGSSSKNAKYILQRIGLATTSTRSPTVRTSAAPSPTPRSSSRPPSTSASTRPNASWSRTPSPASTRRTLPGCTEWLWATPPTRASATPSSVGSLTSRR